ANNCRHPIYLIAARQQRVSYANEIIEWPNLAVMCVTGKHQPCSGGRGALRLPGGVGEKNRCAMRPIRHGAVDRVILCAELCPCCKIIHSCKDQTGGDLFVSIA